MPKERSGSLSATGRGQRACRHLWLRASLVGLLALIDSAGRSAAWPVANGASLASGFASANWYGAPFAHASEPQPKAEDPDVGRILAQPLCVASSAWFGKLGDTVLFVHQRRGDELRVGYFVYFDVERPWGQNLLTYSVLPAMLIDATYSHFAFVFPGIQRLLYGPGDVEGASVAYQVSATGGLTVRDGIADDDTHQRVTLSRSDLVGDEGRVLLMTDVWSHQLGAHGAASYARTPDAKLRCFAGDALQPLTRPIAQSFRLGSFEHPLRARPAFYRDEPVRPSRPTGQLARVSVHGTASP